MNVNTKALITTLVAMSLFQFVLVPLVNNLRDDT